MVYRSLGSLTPGGSEEEKTVLGGATAETNGRHCIQLQILSTVFVLIYPNNDAGNHEKLIEPNGNP